MSLRSRRSSLKRKCTSSITSYNKQQRVWSTATKKLKSKQNAIPSACLFRAKTIPAAGKVRIVYKYKTKKKKSKSKKKRKSYKKRSYEYPGMRKYPRPTTYDEDFPDYVPSGAVADVATPEPVAPIATEFSNTAAA